MKLKIVDKPLDTLKPYENNPRNNDEAVQPVAESIKQFGFKVPIIIDAQGVIIAGHTRYRAAQFLELKTVPCIVADDLTPEQIKAFRLADNKTSELAEWDFELLSAELAELSNIDLDFTMTDFGFEEFTERRDYGHLEALVNTGLKDKKEKLENVTFGVTFSFPIEDKEIIMKYISKKSKEFIVENILQEARLSVD